MTRVKKQILWISSTLIGLCLFALSILCTAELPLAYLTVLALSTVLFLAFLVVLLRTKRMRVVTRCLCIYFLLIGATVVFRGRPPGWKTRQSLRSLWGQKVTDRYLQENLSLGDSPDDVLCKMDIYPSFLNRRSDLVYGMDFATVLKVYGASTELLKPLETEETLSFFVWSRPLCTNGCCRGAVVLTFDEKRLKRIEIYDPSVRPAGPLHAVARCDDDGRFSADRTFQKILSTNLPPPQVILGEPKRRQAAGANK